MALQHQKDFISIMERVTIEQNYDGLYCNHHFHTLNSPPITHMQRKTHCVPLLVTTAIFFQPTSLPQAHVENSRKCQN